MSKLLDYIRLSFFAAGLLLGVQIPALVSDYGHALQAHLIEANTALAPFQKDAQNYFNNDLNKLITHYENSGDAIIGKGADHISTLKNRQQSLQAAVNKFNQSPYIFTLTSDFLTIKKQVWQRFEGQIVLKKDSIIAALVCAIIIAIFAEFIGFVTLFIIKRGYTRLFITGK
ncbi:MULTISPECIES: DUF2937 family protein [unclassified Pseudoalteromonas]|uniref:DUF2937 family protein n=1 Tax=unclassified Pseudoalteromonas TaxID=194690 RepID=UPI0025747006|nr:DUF2937 family protein [Pseudoalteromonas sp. MM1]BED88850.1 hypothetical protein PspMM1_13180 [Pseudoalteromonas sp. MM1]